MAIIVTAGLQVALPARYRVQPAWVVPVASLLAVLIAGNPGRIDRHKTWLRIVTGIVIALRWSSSRAPRIVFPLPCTLSYGPRPYLGPFSPVPLEYSIERLTCTVACSLDTTMVGWAGAAQDRLRAGLPDTRLGGSAVPRRPGDSGRGTGASA